LNKWPFGHPQIFHGAIRHIHFDFLRIEIRRPKQACLEKAGVPIGGEGHRPKGKYGNRNHNELCCLFALGLFRGDFYV
jgi:hypothetical protein